MNWSSAELAREHVRDLHREAARDRLVAQVPSRRSHRAPGASWRRLMGLPSLIGMRALRPAQ